jgi:hypothetical protein
VFHNGAAHPLDMSSGCRRFVGEPAPSADLHELAADGAEHARNEHRFGDAAVLVSAGLERLVRHLREAVEIEAVVPVRPPNERQTVRAAVLYHVMEASLQVFEHGPRPARIAFVRDDVVEHRPVAGLPDVGGRRSNHPERVVVEAAAHLGVPLLGEQLILVECAAVFVLRAGEIQDPLARALGDHVHEAQEILIRVAEPHAAPDAGRLVFRILGVLHVPEHEHDLVRLPLLEREVDPVAGDGRPSARNGVSRSAERWHLRVVRPLRSPVPGVRVPSVSHGHRRAPP